MTAAIRCAAFLVGLSLVAAGSAQELPNLEQKNIKGFLYEGPDGSVLFGVPRVRPGALRLSPSEVYHLAPGSAERFKPLVNNFVLPDQTEEWPYLLDFPRPEDEEKPMMLVQMKTEVRLIKTLSSSMVYSWVKVDPGLIHKYEIVSATVMEVEFLPPDWWHAWLRLDAALESIVAEVLTAPGEEKRRRLAEVIEQGSVALDEMVNAEVREDWREAVAKIDPHLRITNDFQTEKNRVWGELLRTCVQRLRVFPDTPLPGEYGVETARSGMRIAVGVPGSRIVEDLGLVVRELEEKTMAEKLVLGGILIEKVLPEGRNPGFEAGDVVLTCRSLRNLKYRDDLSQMVSQARSSSDSQRDVLVLRDGEVITLALEQGAEFRCLLYAGPGGRVWLAEPLVYLGMVGVWGGHPVYRLSPSLAERLGPLVNHFKDSHAGPGMVGHYCFDLPPLQNEFDWTFLVRLRGRARKVNETLPVPSGPAYRHFADKAVYEITTVRILEVEFISSEWRDAWDRLTGTLRDIVNITLSAPSEEKRRKLTEVIERGSVALNTMAAVRTAETSGEMVREIDPEARLVDAFKQEKTVEWGGVFGRLVARLQIAPETALPAGSEFAAAEPAAESATEQTESVRVEEVGLVLRLLDGTRAAEKMILDGLVIEEVLPAGNDLGFKAGDIVLTYTNLRYPGTGVVSRDWFGRPRRADSVRYQLVGLAQIARENQDGEIQVLRGSDLIGISLEGKEKRFSRDKILGEPKRHPR